MPEDTGLLGIGEYTGRDAVPVSQTQQGTVETTPTPSQPPGHASEPASAPVIPSSPPEPVKPEESKSDLIADLSKAFAKTIGEPPAQPAQQQPTHPVTPPEAPKPAEQTWRDVEAPATATKAAKESWNTFREKAKADVESRDSRIKDLEAQLANERNKLPQHEAQLQEVKKQAQEAMGIVERIAIERSPLFKAKVLDQEALLDARLKQLIEGTGVTPQEAYYLLRGNLGTREQIVENRQISTFRRQQIADTLSKWDNIQEERAQLLDRGRETLQTYLKEQEQQRESARAQFLRESVQVFEDQFQLAKPKLEVYNHIEGNEQWNQSADTLKTIARRLYDGNVSREMVAQAAILAPAAVAYQKLLRLAYGQIQELQAQVDKLKGVQPQIRDTGGDVMQPRQTLSSPNGDFVKGLVDRFKRDTGLQ